MSASEFTNTFSLFVPEGDSNTANSNTSGSGSANNNANAYALGEDAEWMRPSIDTPFGNPPNDAGRLLSDPAERGAGREANRDGSMIFSAMDDYDYGHRSDNADTFGTSPPSSSLMSNGGGGLLATNMMNGPGSSLPPSPPSPSSPFPISELNSNSQEKRRTAKTAWEEEHQKELEEKRAKEESSKREQREEGMKQLARWYELQSTKQQNRRDANRQEAIAKHSSKDEGAAGVGGSTENLKGTASWLRVADILSSVSKDTPPSKKSSTSLNAVTSGGSTNTNSSSSSSSNISSSNISSSSSSCGSSNERDTSRMNRILMELKAGATE